MAVDHVSLDIDAGTIVSMVGPSGCGKTTMLRMIAGLAQPTGGTVQIDPATDSTRGQIGFVFQQPSLLRWRTALENVMLPLELIPSKRSAAERRELATQMLSRVHLQDAASKFPHQLSGGMQMRVSIARALVTRPRILLLDEPFAALDEMLRGQLGELLLELWSDERFTAVMVTHNIAEAVTLSHRIAVMRAGRMVDEIENPLPWPRDQNDRRLSPYSDVYEQVRSSMRGDDLAGPST